MDGITQDTVPVVRVDGQGLLNGDAGDVAKREIIDEDCVDPPHAHIEQAEEEERKAPEQCEVVMNSIPEQKVRWFLYLRGLVRSVLSVRVSVSVFMESVVTLSHSYLTPRSLLSNVLSHLPDLHADVHIRACFFNLLSYRTGLHFFCRKHCRWINAFSFVLFFKSRRCRSSRLKSDDKICHYGTLTHSRPFYIVSIVTAKGPQYSTALSALLLFKNSYILPK